MPNRSQLQDLLNQLENDLRSREHSPQAYQENKTAWALLEQTVRSLSHSLLASRWKLADDDVEDSLQQVLLKFQSLETLRRVRSAGNVEGYIAVMLKNVALDLMRRRELEHRLFHPLDEEVVQQKPAAAPDLSREMETGRRSVLREELRSLPAEDKALLRMRFWKGMSIQQIAKETGLTYSATAVRLFRILHRMRAHMEQQNTWNQ
jgi:RNA polymerase sigma-70 factor (ECF subfamily)